MPGSDPFGGTSGGGKTSNKTPTTNIKPATTQTQALQKLQTTWENRTNSLLPRGYNYQKAIQPVIQYDISRVKSGGKGLSSLEAQSIIDSLKSGKNPFKPKSTGGGGILGIASNILSDVAGIGVGLLHLPEVVGGDLYKAGHMLVDSSYANKELKKMGVKNPNDWSELNPLKSHFWDVASRLPVVRLMPGVYTGDTIANGQWKDFQDHPLMHLLDVLPYASEAGKVLGAGSEAEVGSIREALQVGQPLKAISRIPIVGKSPADAAKAISRTLHVSSEVREGERIANRAIRSAPTKEMKGALDAWGRLQNARSGRDALLVEADKFYNLSEHAKAKDFEHRASTMTAQILKDAGTVGRAAQAVKVEYFVDTLGKTTTEVFHDVNQSLDRGKFKRTINKSSPFESDTRTIIQDQYVPLKDFMGKFGLSKAERTWLEKSIKESRGVTTGDILVPKWLAKAYDESKFNQLMGTSAGKFYDKTTDVFRYAVLTGPRHFVHINASNMVFSMLREGPQIFRHWSQAWDMVKNPEKWVNDVARGLGTFSRTDEIIRFKFGDTLARLWEEAGKNRAARVPVLGKGAQVVASYAKGMKLFESLSSDMFRAMSYLEESGKGKAIGLDELGAHKYAMDALTKIYMDIDGLTPIEKNIFRRVVPFYSFERQLISYALRFPADHPWRAAILSSVGRVEMEQVGSELPLASDSLFFFGSPDASGNVKVVDLRNLDPFRTFATNDPLTLTGFLSSLNPVIKAPFVATMGPNSLFGSPDFYQQLTVDPYSGAYRVKQDPLQAMLYGAEQILPPLNSLDAILQYSQQARSLAQSSDKGALRKFVFNNLNIPFSPYSYNESQAKAKYIAHLYTVSKQQAINYTQDNRYSDISQYQKIPFGRNLVTPQQLQQLQSQVQKVKAG